MRKTFRALLAGTVLAAGLVAAPAAANAATQVCWSPTNPKMALKLSNDIQAAMRGRQTTMGVGVWDRKHKVTCWVRSTTHFDAASTIKASILAALLYKKGGPGNLTSWERGQARLMITQSDNTAATNLWNDVGMTALKRFLTKAGMTHTGLSSAWGLTQETAHDEVVLLTKLTAPSLLSTASRNYELSLMNQVVAGQGWGTPYGHPAGVTVHVKNGWLPRATHGWRINSLGTFNGGGRDYMIALLSTDNPSESYGITSLQRVARVIHHDLNPGSSFTAREQTGDYPANEISDGSATP
ncbi:MAG: secreted protein [Actinomycetia bacterium]|nr:secreted protein [Actinomycetes bacterium]